MENTIKQLNTKWFDNICNKHDNNIIKILLDLQFLKSGQNILFRIMQDIKTIVIMPILNTFNLNEICLSNVSQFQTLINSSVYLQFIIDSLLDDIEKVSLEWHIDSISINTCKIHQISCIDYHFEHENLYVLRKQIAIQLLKIILLTQENLTLIDIIPRKILENGNEPRENTLEGRIEEITMPRRRHSYSQNPA